MSTNNKPQGHVSIGLGVKLNHRQIWSSSDFFRSAERMIITVLEDKIIFRIPDLDYRGKSLKVNRSIKYMDQITIVDDSLPVVKKLDFDEDESNDDQVVVYFNDADLAE